MIRKLNNSPEKEVETKLVWLKIVFSPDFYGQDTVKPCTENYVLWDFGDVLPIL